MNSDVIVPLTVLRCLEAVLEPTKPAVYRDQGHAGRGPRQQLEVDCDDDLDAVSPNVRGAIGNFEFRNSGRMLSMAMPFEDCSMTIPWAEPASL